STGWLFNPAFVAPLASVGHGQPMRKATPQRRTAASPMHSLLTALVLAATTGLVLAQAPASTPASQPPPDAPIQQVAASNRDTQWRPSEAQAQRVVRVTYAYFAAKD